MAAQGGALQVPLDDPEGALYSSDPRSEIVTAASQVLRVSLGVRSYHWWATSTTTREWYPGPARTKTRYGSRARTPRPIVV
jgi:hypothetical protein